MLWMVTVTILFQCQFFLRIVNPKIMVKMTRIQSVQIFFRFAPMSTIWRSEASKVLGQTHSYSRSISTKLLSLSLSFSLSLSLSLFSLYRLNYWASIFFTFSHFIELYIQQIFQKLNIQQGKLFFLVENAYLK